MSTLKKMCNIITGGTFGFDPTKWVPAEGYSITKENGSWTVTVK